MRHDVDVVVGTRYAGGGSGSGLGGLARAATSSGATRLAKTLFPRRLATVRSRNRTCSSAKTRLAMLSK